MYEQRRNLDRQAGLASENSGKKRKHEDEEKSKKDKEEKSKHKKEKKDKEKKKDEDSAVQKEEKVKKEEEEEERSKPSKKEEEIKKSLEEERPSYSKKDEDEQYKHKKDEKYRYSRRDEDDRYKYSREEEYRYRHHRDDDDRYDERSKYGPRDEYKYEKYSDFRSKYDRERDEGKLKAEREALKKPEQGKPAGKLEASKPEPPPKPYELPKIFCGPSPAMRAKLRKQNMESGKTPPATTTSSFAKFTWKKRENVLAKEAEKVAAEFIKDDEAATNPTSVEDSFAKSMAVAKEIAEKLGGQNNMPPPWVSNSANRGRIRPNLPAPAGGRGFRRTAMMGKPASLNTFLSIRPQNPGLLGPSPKEPPLFSDGLTRALNAQSALLESKPQPQGGTPGTGEATPAPTVSKSPPVETKPPPPVSKPPPFEADPAPPVSKPAPLEAKPAPLVATAAPSQTTPAPSVVEAAQPAVIKIVSDVAAPGVPESEQTRTMFVKPPPLMNVGYGAQKSEKHKSNLAAAKAQDLFDIFYNSVGQSGISSITKPATDVRTDESSNNKSQLSTPQAPKPQPQGKPVTQSQPPSVDYKSPEPDSQRPQDEPKSDILIKSVWSLQPEVASSDTQKTQPKLNPPARSAAQSVPPNQSEAQSVQQNQFSTPKPESQIALQTKPAELEQTPQSLSQLKLVPQIQTEPQPDQDTQLQSHLKTHPETAPEPEPKPGPKTRGKRTPPAPRPVRQTRSQTRYQTRQQQQSQPESEPEVPSGDSDSAASDPRGPDTSNPGSGLETGEGAPSEEDPQKMEITPETLGLPSDMTSLGFDYNFNFE